MVSVEILEKYPIFPADSSLKDAILPLTFFDIVWLFTGPVERVFFYPFPHSTSYFITRCLPTLKSSLLRTIEQYYPLAGRAKPSSEDSNKYVIELAPEHSTYLSITECHADFHHLCGSHSRDFSSVYSLIPQLPRAEDGSVPLLALQATVFPEQGIAIGVSVHHVACDDYSAIQFMKTWAEVCAGGDPSQSLTSPSFDRTVIQDTDGLYHKILAEMQALMASGPPPPPLPPIEMVITSFTITTQQIAKLKQGVMSMPGKAENTHISTFSVACGFAWMCLIKAQKEFYATKDTAHLLFSVECRARLSPPAPQGYFGNCLRPCFVEVNMNDLLKKENGAFVAAEAIGRAVKGLNDGLLDGAENWLQKIISLGPYRPMSIAGSPKYGVYDVDFGWGKPAKVEMTSIEKTPGTISMAKSVEGGVQIGLVLPKAEMDEFTSCLQQNLMLLI